VSLFKAAGLDACGFTRAEEFLGVAERSAPGCVVSDIKLPGLSGLELHRTVVDRDLPMHVVMITGHGDIPMAVEAMRDGALDFIEKPFDARALIESVNRALGDVPRLAREHDQRAQLRLRRETLSARELEVLSLVIAGNQTKVIAHKLGISPRTAETHRARMMEKMGARSLSELIRWILALESPRRRSPASSDIV